MSQLDFQRLYESNLRLVRKVVSGFGFTNGTADDLAQQTFLQAYERLDSLRQPEMFTSWVAAIARNACLSELRRGKRTVPLDDSSPGRGTERSSRMDVVLSVDPEDKIAELDAELSLEFLEAVFSRYRKEPRGTVARMYYKEGLNTREISAAKGMPQNTVLSHLHKFRLEMKQALVALESGFA